MPYKDRTQLNLKLTAAEHTQLKEEAALAGISLHTYVGHLLRHRPVQPLSVQAAQLQARYAGRDELMTLKLTELNSEIRWRQQLQQRVTELEQENEQLRDPMYIKCLIQEALNRHESDAEAS
jgi:predicted DNA binding CopG/RHH family protein